jgi:hypothetical protein
VRACKVDVGVYQPKSAGKLTNAPLPVQTLSQRSGLKWVPMGKHACFWFNGERSRESLNCENPNLGYASK